MRRTCGCAALAVFMPFLGLLAQPQPTVRRSIDPRKAEREVLRASAEEVRALLAADLNALARIWSDDLVVTNPLNQLVNKRQVLALIESDTLAFRSYDRRIEYVHAYDGFVVVAGTELVVWAGGMPLAGLSSSLRFTALWIERDGRWQEVARHANIVSRTAELPRGEKSP